MRRLHQAGANIERRADDVVDPCPLHRKHRSDDVNDRVEGTDFMQVYPLDRHLVNARLGFGESVEHRLGAIPAGRRKRGAVDESFYFRQTPVRVCVDVLGIAPLIASMRIVFGGRRSRWCVRMRVIVSGRRVV